MGTLLVASLLVASCGTRLPDEQRALYSSASSGRAAVDDASTATGSQSKASATGKVTTGGTDADAVTTPDGSETGNDGAAVVAGADGSGETAGSDGPVASACTAPSTEVGVADDVITIGNVSQLSGVIPGFAQPAIDGAQAYVAYTNANGGVCGRALELVVADDGFDAARNSAEVKRLSSSVLAFGGGFSVSDSGYSTALAGTNIVDSGTATTAERKASENNYNAIPLIAGGPEFVHAAKQGVTKAVIVHVAAAAGRTQAEAQQERLEQAGIATELLEVSNTQFSFAGPARNVMDSGAQLMVFISSVSGAVQMAKEMRELGPPLDFEIYAGIYGPSFIEQAGKNAEGAVSVLQFLPFEEAASNAELTNYIGWLNRVAPNEPPGFYSFMGWVQMKILIDAIRGVDGPLTRDALLASMQTFTAFDADGAIPPVDLVNKSGQGCKVLVTVANGKWTRLAPSSGFVC